MTEHILLEQVFDRTADQLLDQLNADAYRGSTVTIWLFEGLAKRQAIEAELATRNIKAQVYSAYKPLVHFFLENVHADVLQAAQIVYPRHAVCVDNRYLLEAYPLAGLFPRAKIEFIEGPRTGLDSDTGTEYQVTLHYADRQEVHRVFAPNVLKTDFLGRTVYTPSAWLMVERDGQICSTAVSADYQQSYDAAMAAVMGHDWGSVEPYFDRLIITLNLPGIEQPLAYGRETISTTEAMHEEIYFSILEYFQQHSGREPGSRGLQPGQIIPDIRLDDQGPIRLKVGFDPVRSVPGDDLRGPLLRLDQKEIATGFVDLATVDAPLPPLFIERSLQGFSGQHFAFASKQGRAVNTVYIQGELPSVLISGAQHANETSGVVGALRAARQLSAHAGAHFVLMPLENPDGYALHQTLCATNPGHMHHAARYTALGDDIEYREHAPWFEREARNHAFALSQAQLHLNLHGYPAHEWTRPCTGYLPRGFELWSIPKGLFLILRYKEGWRDTALALLEHVTGELAANDRLMAFNAEQLACYQHHSNTMPFQVHNGIPYTATQANGQQAGVTLITEFPDETIYGDEFIFAHSVQAQTVVSACEWWWKNAGRR